MLSEPLAECNSAIQPIAACATKLRMGLEEGGVSMEYQLSPEEVAAVLTLAKTPFELYAMRKLLPNRRLF